jgi:hypothetical protein
MERLTVPKVMSILANVCGPNLERAPEFAERYMVGFVEADICKGELISYLNQAG